MGRILNNCLATLAIALAFTTAAAAKTSYKSLGSMIVGYDTTCSATQNGAIRFNSASLLWTFCNGSAWSALRSNCISGTAGPDSSLASNLVAYYNFDENTGSVVNDFIGNNYGTWQGTLGSQWTTGIINYAGNFNGTDNIVNIPGIAALGVTGSFSISAWVKAGGTSSNASIVMKNSDIGGSGWGLQLSQSTTQWSAAAVTNGSGFSATGGTVTTGAWTFLVSVFDSSVPKVYLYINGALITSTATSGSALRAIASHPSFIGGGNGGSYSYYTGAIDEVGFWNTALTASNITALYNSGSGNTYSSNLVSCPATVTAPTSGGFAH